MSFVSLENQSQLCKEAGDLAAPSLRDVVYTAQASPEQ